MIRKGFTLIELLIVIAVLAILAVAVLSAINPVEQLRKGRDAARKSDAAELLNASERYLTTFGCPPWDNVGALGCTPGANPTADAPDFETPIAVGSVDVTELFLRQEVKPQFTTRDSVTNAELKVSEVGDMIAVCFTPESQSGRGGGLGPIMNDQNTAAGTGCLVDYDPAEAECNVCVPQ